MPRRIVPSLVLVLAATGCGGMSEQVTPLAELSAVVDAAFVSDAVEVLVQGDRADVCGIPPDETTVRIGDVVAELVERAHVERGVGAYGLPSAACFPSKYRVAVTGAALDGVNANGGAITISDGATTWTLASAVPPFAERRLVLQAPAEGPISPGTHVTLRFESSFGLPPFEPSISVDGESAPLTVDGDTLSFTMPALTGPAREVQGFVRLVGDAPDRCEGPSSCRLVPRAWPTVRLPFAP